MKLPRHSPVAYNPHLLRREALVESFTARQPLLDQLLDDLRRGGKQHHLLIGPRGSGKTTFLLRLGFAIEDDKKLSKRAIALRFPEEQYNVGQLSDLWLNCADALVDALERRGDTELARELDKTIELLELLPEVDRAPEGLKLLTSWTHKSKRNLILLVDNLDLILDRLESAHWSLRETFSADNGLVLIGASSSFIQESFAYESPFYDFFNVHELGPLSEAEARALVLRLSVKNETPQVRRAIESEPGRFAALYLVSGGSPRTLTLLHGVLAQEQSARAEDDLELLLDGLTPYYKSRFDDLAAQSQLVVNAVALHWNPMTAAECAAETRMDVGVVSAQLNRLVRQGVLAKVAGAEPHRLSFQIAERFFNIWYLMRASRRARRKLLWLVKFLQAFYGNNEVERRARALLDSVEGRAAAEDPARLLAYASSIQDEALRRRLEFRAVEALISEPVHRGELAELLDLRGEDAHLAPMLDRVTTLRDVRALVARSKVVKAFGITTAAAGEALASSVIISLAGKRQLAEDMARGGEAAARYLKGLCSTDGDPSSFLGARLCAAVGRGEVPSLADVRELDEFESVVALVDDKGVLAAVAVGLAFVATREAPADALIAYLTELSPICAFALVIAAAFHLAAGRENVASLRLDQALRVHHDHAFIGLSDARTWHAFVKMHELPKLVSLMRSKESERLLPLVEALRAAADGSRGPLPGLAPEVRAPAEQILAALYAEEPDPPAAPPASVARAKKPPAKRRTRH